MSRNMFAVAALIGFALACGKSESPPSQSGGPRMHVLTVTASGGGSVKSAPAGIDCGATCSASFTEGTQVTLSTSAPAGTAFSDWDGACGGQGAQCGVDARDVRGDAFQPGVLRALWQHKFN